MKCGSQSCFRLTLSSFLQNFVVPAPGNAPQRSSYAAVFQSFTGKFLFKQGQQVHAHMVIRGVHPDAFVAAKMVAMYASSGDLCSASWIYRSIDEPSRLLFNSTIRALSLFRFSEDALVVYVKMHSLNCRGDHFTYPFVLKSVADLELDFMGKCTHGLCVKDGWVFYMYVSASLVDMYAKCGVMGDARKMFDEISVKDIASWNAMISGYMRDGTIDFARSLFDQMPQKNIFSWTSMISGYTQNGLGDEALQLFDEISREESEVKPNWVTIMSILPACGSSSALERGRKIHSFAREKGLDSHPSVLTALIGMYAKCGSLNDARHCFDRLDRKSLVAWNAMITAYSSHGLGKDAVEMFEFMVRDGVSPDGITFTGLLSGCSHSGLVDIGLTYFDSMDSIYKLEKEHEHYACVVDLLGRAGRLVEAYELISKMPMQPGASVWGSLLASSRSHHNLEIAELAAEKLFILEPECSGNYAILSNMYAEANMWEEVNNLRALQKSNNVKKTPGCSWIEINGIPHLFHGGDASYALMENIQLLLKEISDKIKAAGYVPNTCFSLHDVSEEEKEHSLATHSEKLAVAFGLLNTPSGTVIRITKNLRICGDCHTVMKFVSNLYNREIILRDLNRFHHFKEGSCSCADYW